MSSEMYSAQLSSREQEILAVLWAATEPLNASGIVKITPLSINTVQAVLKKLLDRGLIEVADITYSGTVLSRRYRTTVSQNAYTIKRFLTHFRKTNGDFSTPMIITALLKEEENEEDLLEELETMLEERKKNLKGK